MSLLALLKIHKNTRRFYIPLQAFWQAENRNQAVLVTAKNAAKKPKTYQNRRGQHVAADHLGFNTRSVPARETGSGLIVFA